MAITYTTAVKTDRITATRDYFAGGTLELLDGATVLAVFDLSVSGGTISTDTWTVTFDSTTATAVADGTADGARLKDSGGTVGLSGLAVGVEVTINTATVTTGDTIAVSAVTIQHA